MQIYIDIETYSSVDLGKSGVYKYVESEDFDILLFCVAYESGPGIVYDVAGKDVSEYPEELMSLLSNGNVLVWAHNSNFERVCLSHKGIHIAYDRWRDTMVLSLYNGLPGSLKSLSSVLSLENAKLSEGKSLIKLFSMPDKNGNRHTRETDPEEWANFIEYNKYDVLAEREIYEKLTGIVKSDVPESEWKNFYVDQRINDRGVFIDEAFVNRAFNYANGIRDNMLAKGIEGVENANSVKQLSEWYCSRFANDVVNGLTAHDKELLKNESYGSLFKPEEQPMTKAAIDMLLKLDAVRRIPELSSALSMRVETGSIAYTKYGAIQSCMCDNGRVHGMFKFYGASRTGRWSSNLVQLHNLAKPHFDNVDEMRDCIKGIKGTPDDVLRLLGSTPITSLGQLIRTSFIPSPDKNKFVIADYSAIEARVISWYADEEWRLDVFKGDGKIYEATASRMFNIPVEQIKKDSPERAKGKVSELALGYGGGVSALKLMGGSKMGLSDDEMQNIVNTWRNANPGIVRLWNNTFAAFKKAILSKSEITLGNLKFGCNKYLAYIVLPSGRRLSYWGAKIDKSTGNIAYAGTGTAGAWCVQRLYGGKLVENIVQATARDILCDLMVRLDGLGHKVVLHVHDEVVIDTRFPDNAITAVDGLMRKPPVWAEGLPLKGEAFISDYYTK